MWWCVLSHSTVAEDDGGVCCHTVLLLKMISYTPKKRSCLTNLNTSVVIRAKTKQADIQKTVCLLLQMVAHPILLTYESLRANRCCKPTQFTHNFVFTIENMENIWL